MLCLEPVPPSSSAFSGRFCAPALPIVVLHRGAPSAGFDAIAKSLNAVPASLAEPDAIPRIVQAAIDQRRRSSVLIIEDDPDAAETARRALDADAARLAEQVIAGPFELTAEPNGPFVDEGSSEEIWAIVNTSQDNPGVNGSLPTFHHVGGRGGDVIASDDLVNNG